LSALTSIQRKWILVRLTNEDKATVWKNRLQRKLQTTVNVNQANFLREIHDLIKPSIFEKGTQDDIAFQANIDNHVERAFNIFGENEAKEIFGDVTFPADLNTDAVYELALQGSLVSYLDTFADDITEQKKCNCLWSGWTGCGKCQATMECGRSRNGCGFLGLMECIGLCRG
jgi:hypothetical protein